MMTSTATAQPVNTTQPAPTMQPNVFQQSAGALNSGIGTATGVAGYKPMNVSAATYQPTTVAGTSLTPYMNPYQQAVIDTTMQGLADQQAMTMNGLDAQASAAGAFGGSRHGVAMGTTNDAYAQQQAETLAALNAQNFNNAMGVAQFDVGQQNTAGQFNAGTNMQAQLANQQAGLAGAGLNLDAANTLGNLSNLGFGQGMAINNQQATQGAQIQAMNQALIDAAKMQYAGFTGQPNAALAMLLGGAQVPTGNTQTGSQSYNPGLFDYLSLGMSI